MMKLNKVGFFRELKHGIKDGPSLQDVVSKLPDANEGKILEYLKKGILLIACPGLVRDVLNPSSDFMDNPHILTDGVWAWPNDLAHYVQKYHVRLPVNFLEHMQSNDWEVPKETTINLQLLEID